MARLHAKEKPMRLSALLLVLLCGACQTAPKPEAPKTQTWEEFIRARPSTFIANRTQQLAHERQLIEQRGLAEEYKRIRALVDAHLPPGDYTMQEPGATAAILRQHRVDSTTVSLLEYGYRSRHLAARQQAYSLVRAAASGFGDADSLVLLSPVVLVAELHRIDRKPDNSAYLVYRVTEPIKSAPPPGSEFRLLLNPPFPTIVPKPGDPPPPPPPPNPPMSELGSHKSAVFFLRPRESLLRPRTDEVPDHARTLFGPMPISGEQVMPGYHSGTSPTTLPAIRAAARAQLCSPGYVPVVEGANLAHKC